MEGMRSANRPVQLDTKRFSTQTSVDAPLKKTSNADRRMNTKPRYFQLPNSKPASSVAREAFPELGLEFVISTRHNTMLI